MHFSEKISFDLNKKRTQLRSVSTRQDFYAFALFNGFQTNLDRHYVPKEGDQVLFYWADSTSVIASLAAVVFKFGRPHLRLFYESGSRDHSITRDFSFLGRMMRVAKEGRHFPFVLPPH